MCAKPRVPKLPPRPAAPPAPQQTAQTLGAATGTQTRERLDPNTLRRFSLRFPPNFQIPQ